MLRCFNGSDPPTPGRSAVTSRMPSAAVTAVVGVLAQTRVAGPVLEEHRDAVRRADDFVRELPSIADRECLRHPCSIPGNAPTDDLARRCENQRWQHCERVTPMNTDLEGRVAIVTGGGRDLGRVLALALADAGADVAVIGRTEAPLDEVAAMVTARGRRAWSHVCDVTDDERGHADVRRDRGGGRYDRRPGEQRRRAATAARGRGHDAARAGAPRSRSR